MSTTHGFLIYILSITLPIMNLNKNNSNPLRTTPMITKNVVLTLFITFLSYAIVSSIGQPQHNYSAPYSAAIAD